MDFAQIVEDEMDAISGVGNLPVGGGWSQIYGTAGAGMLPAQGAAGTAAGNAVAASQSALSVSSTSITAGAESYMASIAPAASNNELLGAVLLLLTMEYLKTDNQDDKKDLLGLITLLAQQQQQSAAGGTVMYSSSSLSIESTQIQYASSDVALSAYNGATASLQQAPGVDPGAGGLNVVA